MNKNDWVTLGIKNDMLEPINIGKSKGECRKHAKNLKYQAIGYFQITDAETVFKEVKKWCIQNGMKEDHLNMIIPITFQYILELVKKYA